VSLTVYVRGVTVAATPTTDRRAIREDDSMTATHLPTIVTVPCFSGAPWDLDSLTPLADYPLRTMRLPDAVDDIEEYADFVSAQVADLDDYVLVGDSFGAVIALALAARRPTGLRALVLSGGFAANPVTTRSGRLKIRAARFLPGPLYRQLVLRMHAAALASPFDREAERPLSTRQTRQLFLDNTPWRSYVARADAALRANYTDRLERISVPTLILTPEHDTLIGQHAATVLRTSVPGAVEHVLPGTGHMLRFTHPRRYAAHIAEFLAARLAPVRADR
jgi:pimeloyl-ACP methyl ester carboxylesterase